jgi:hypothetical protein
VPDAWREIIEMPIKTAVVFKERAKNSLGIARIGLEFLKYFGKTWQVI